MHLINAREDVIAQDRDINQISEKNTVQNGPKKWGFLSVHLQEATEATEHERQAGKNNVYAAPHQTRTSFRLATLDMWLLNQHKSTQHATKSWTSRGHTQPKGTTTTPVTRIHIPFVMSFMHSVQLNANGDGGFSF